jgi:hypothetical protein
MKKILLSLAALAALLFATFFVLPPRHKYGSFSGNETFRFCGAEKTGFLLKYQTSCQQFCRYITGKNCQGVRSKAQKIEKDTCYGYAPQTILGDPCLYCSVQCQPLPTPTGQADKCDIGKNFINASERPNYACETMPGCEWRPLGGKIQAHYACCPKNVHQLEDELSQYGRCFIMID